MGTLAPPDLSLAPAVAAKLISPDRHPVAVYLAALAPGSRRSLAQALDSIAGLASVGRLDRDAFAWPALRYQHTAAIRAAVAERFAPSTANRMLAALRGVLMECWRLGYMSAEDFHRASDVKTIKGTRVPAGRMLTAGELTALFASCAEDPAAGGRLDAAILALLVGCGLRRAEAAVLDVGDLDMESGDLRVRSGKGNRDRIVPLVNGQKEAVVDWLAVRGGADGALLCPVNKSARIDVRRMSSQALYMRLRKRAERAGVREFTPHDLRRTFISSLLDHGADISAVQRLAGHATVTTTTRYDRRDERAKRRAAELLHVPDFGPGRADP